MFPKFQYIASESDVRDAKIPLFGVVVLQGTAKKCAEALFSPIKPGASAVFKRDQKEVNMLSLYVSMYVCSLCSDQVALVLKNSAISIGSD